MRADSKNKKTGAWWEYVPVAWEERFYELLTGITMCCLRMGPENGTPVMLIHGAGDCRISWSFVAPKLADAGFRVYIPELRGHGKTSVPITDKGYYEIDDYAADIAALFDALGLERAHLVGHSLGSLTSQMMTVHHPERVISATFLGSGTQVNQFKDYKASENEVYDDNFLREWSYCTLDSEAFREACYQYVKQLPQATWRQVFNGLKYYDSREALASVTCPVQIIWGTKDIFFLEDDQKSLRESLYNAKVKYVPLEGCSHQPHWDEWGNIDLFAELLISFINGQ